MRTSQKVNRSTGWVAADKRRNDALERIADALEAQVTPELQDLATKTAEAVYRAARMDEDAAALRRSVAKRQWANLATPSAATSDPAGTSEQEASS